MGVGRDVVWVWLEAGVWPSLGDLNCAPAVACMVDTKPSVGCMVDTKPSVGCMVDTKPPVGCMVHTKPTK